MKLISGFILQDLGDEHMAVATGEAGILEEEAARKTVTHAVG